MRGTQSLGLGLVALSVMAIAIVVSSACGGSPSTPAPGVPTGTPAAPVELTEARLTEEAAAGLPAVLTLTIWTTEAFSPTEVITSGAILAQQVADFEARQSGVRLRFVPKKPYGKGGVLDYLLTTGVVVPELLPDLAFIDADELPAAVKASLAQPLDELIGSDVAADLYPFARESCTFEKKLYGLQILADLDHLVYDVGQIEAPPLSWSAVLGMSGPYLFPAGGQAGLVNDAFLIQYLGVWAQPAGAEPDAPFLEEGALTAVLQYYRDGVSRGIFAADILDYHTAEDVWRDYLDGRAQMAEVSAHGYLLEHSRAQDSAVAPIPAINGPARALSRGWALVLITPEPVRQVAAARLLTYLLAPENHAAWSRAAGYLPVRRSALALWGDGGSYASFIEQQLQEARPRPRLQNQAQVAAALQEAVVGVITGALTPEEAAAQVLEDSQ